MGGGGRLSDIVGGANGVGSGGKVAAVRVGEGLSEGSVIDYFTIP